jgi:hypothetical protein
MAPLKFSLPSGTSTFLAGSDKQNFGDIQFHTAGKMKRKVAALEKVDADL